MNLFVSMAFCITTSIPATCIALIYAEPFPKKRGHYCFLAMCILSALWNIGYAGMFISQNPDYTRGFYRFVLIGSLFIFPLMFKLMEEISERRYCPLQQFEIYMTALAAMLFVIVARRENLMLVHLDWGGLDFCVPQAGGATVLLIAYYTIIGLVFLYSLYQWVKAEGEKRRVREQAGWLCLCVFVCFLALALEYGSLFVGMPSIPIGGISNLLLLVITFIMVRRYNTIQINTHNFAEYIYSSTKTPILIFDNEGRLALANKCTPLFFDLPAGALMGRRPEDLFLRVPADGVGETHSDSPVQMTRFNSVCRFNKKPCDITVTNVYDAYSEVIGTIYVVYDMTENMRRIQLLDRMRRAEVESNRLKSTFLANMSHEIRTPINAVIGMSEILMRKKLPDDLRADVGVIHSAGQGLLAIISEILDFSKIESGKFELIETEYMLPALVETVVHIIGVRFSKKPVCLLIDIEPDTPIGLFGDNQRVQQILLNLLSNAEKFTQSGYVRLYWRWEHAGEDMVRMIISVEDTGSGIRPENLEKIFAQYQQVDAKSNRALVGTGLGLAIGREMARMMGGDITVESEYGKGSVFTVTFLQKILDNRPVSYMPEGVHANVLICGEIRCVKKSIEFYFPRLGVDYTLCTSPMEAMRFDPKTYTHVMAPAAEIRALRAVDGWAHIRFIQILEAMEYVETLEGDDCIHLPLLNRRIVRALSGEDKAAPDIVWEPERMENVRVLIVDDSPVNLQVAAGLLEPYHMAVDLAASGAEAIELAKKNFYDLVMLDHMMPEMDGVETAERLRALPDYGRVPIVALTANATNTARKMFLENGFDDFLAKPINLLQLDLMLKKWVGSRLKAPVAVAAPPLNMSGGEGLQERNPSLDIPVLLDAQAGIDALGGNLQVYTHVIDAFCVDAVQRADELEKLADSNLRDFTISVHALKSACRSIGGALAADEAARLEQAGKEGDEAYIGSALPSFLAHLRALITEARKWLEENKAQEAPGRQAGLSSAEEIRGKLAALRRACECAEINRAEKLADELLAEICDERIHLAVKAVRASLVQFDYIQAVDQIDQLLKEENYA